MKIYDQGSSLFWLLLSIIIFVESLHLGIGTAKNPGLGFFAFVVSGLLGVLSFVLFIQASLKKEETKIKPLFAGILWKRVLFVFIIILIYSRVMPLLGYVISTFILMTCLFFVLERKKMARVFIYSFLTVILTFFVFSKWLNCQFPDGLFGF